MTNEIIIKYDIGVESPIAPEAQLPAFPAVPERAIVIIGGRSPVWQYAKAVAVLVHSPADAVAVYDPRLGGAVVVSTWDRRTGFKVGDVIPYQWE